MAEIIINTVFKLKRGYSQDWISQNPVLAEGEPGYELDTCKLKIGNGITDWNHLNYVPGFTFVDDENNEISLSQLAITGSIYNINEIHTTTDDTIQSEEDNYLIFHCGTAKTLI